MYKLLKVGSDCEIFLTDLSGRPLPVVGLLGGTKEKPRPILDEEGFAVQEDNVMPEFNIPACSDVTSFVTSINKALAFLSYYFHEKDFISLDLSASVLFDEKDLETNQARTVGCEPDYCVWTKTKSQLSAKNPLFKQLRTAGGHAHFSYEFDGRSPVEYPDEITDNFVKMNDLQHGVASVLLDTDTRRKLLYGKAGAFRYKEYGKDAGHEYRVLSNFWLKSDALKAWVFNQAEECVRQLNADTISFYERDLGLKVQHCINTNDKELAAALCKEYKIALP